MSIEKVGPVAQWLYAIVSLLIRGMAHGMLGVLGGNAVVDGGASVSVPSNPHHLLMLSVVAGLFIGVIKVLNYLDDNPLPALPGLNIDTAKNP